MSKHIAVAASLGIVGFFFWSNLFPPIVSESVSALTRPLPTTEEASASTLAWGTWENYLKAANAHDLAQVKALSYQLSPACSDPKRESECFVLMDSVYFFAKDFKQADFKNIKTDGRQMVLYSSGPEMKFIYFIRETFGQWKVSSLKFCYTSQDKLGDTCVTENVDSLFRN